MQGDLRQTSTIDLEIIVIGQLPKRIFRKYISCSFNSKHFTELPHFVVLPETIATQMN